MHRRKKETRFVVKRISPECVTNAYLWSAARILSFPYIHFVGKALAISCISLSLKHALPAAALERALSIRLAPGMGNITGEYARSQAIHT